MKPESSDAVIPEKSGIHLAVALGCPITTLGHDIYTQQQRNLTSIAGEKVLNCSAAVYN